MNNKVLIVSIKPEYASKIFSGDKTIELRKCMPNVKKGDRIIIYVTDPVKAIKGIGTIDNIVEGTPAIIWKNYNIQTGISKKTFFDYYSNSYRAIGIVISNICEFKEELKLQDIKKKIPSFAPPQTFKYSTEVELIKSYKLAKLEVA